MEKGNLENLEKVQCEAKAQELKNKFGAVYKKHLLELNGPLTDFINKLRTYKDYEDVLLYHALSGTVDPNRGWTKYNFPDNDSVEAFIERVCAQYN